MIRFNLYELQKIASVKLINSITHAELAFLMLYHMRIVLFRMVLYSTGSNKYKIFSSMSQVFKYSFQK